MKIPFFSFFLLLFFLSESLLAKEEKSESSNSSSSSKKGPDDSKALPPYFRITDMCIPVIKKGNAVAFLKTTVELKVSDSSDMKLVENFIPRFRSNCYLYFIPLFSKFWVEGVMITIPQMIKHMEKVAKDSFEDIQVEQINFTEYYFYVPSLNSEHQESTDDNTVAPS